MNADEKLEVAREMMGSFTAEELAGGADVSSEKTHDKINYWLAIGTVEAGTTTEYGHVAYRLAPEPT